MKEALLYQKLDDHKARCNVCNQRCTINPGKRGICGVRENREGVLWSLNYGKTISAAIDPIEKKPLYHFLPGTNIYSIATVGCNFHCLWCQNWEISQSPKPDNEVEGVDVTPQEHIEKAKSYNCPSIAYTYSEPTIFLEYALDIMKLAKKEGLKNVWVTNGYMTKETLDLIIPYLDAANVDLKCWDDQAYIKYCGGKAKPIMDNIKYMHERGVHQEITTLIVPGVNDSREQLEKIAGFLANDVSKEIPWHITRFFPAWKMLDTPITPIETLKMAQEIGEKAGLKYIHIGNV